MDSDEKKQVRALIKTDRSMAQHLAYAHTQLQTNVRDGRDFSSMIGNKKIAQKMEKIEDHLEDAQNKIITFISDGNENMS